MFVGLCMGSRFEMPDGGICQGYTKLCSRMVQQLLAVSMEWCKGTLENPLEINDFRFWFALKLQPIHWLLDEQNIYEILRSFIAVIRIGSVNESYAHLQSHVSFNFCPCQTWHSRGTLRLASLPFWAKLFTKSMLWASLQLPWHSWSGGSDSLTMCCSGAKIRDRNTKGSIPSGSLW